MTALLRKVGDDRSGLSEGTPCSWTRPTRFSLTGTVDDDLWSRFAQRFDEPQLIELLVLIGTYRMVADLLNGRRNWNRTQKSGGLPMDKEHSGYEHSGNERTGTNAPENEPATCSRSPAFPECAGPLPTGWWW